MVRFAWRCAAAERKGLAARGRLGDRCAALLFALLHLRTSMLECVREVRRCGRTVAGS